MTLTELVGLVVGIIAIIGGVFASIRIAIKRIARADARADRMAEANRELARRAEADARIEHEERTAVNAVIERAEVARKEEDLGSLLDEAARQREKLEKER